MARDPVAAGQAMFDHLTAVERDLITHLDTTEVEPAAAGPLATSPTPS